MGGPLRFMEGALSTYPGPEDRLLELAIVSSDIGENFIQRLPLGDAVFLQEVLEGDDNVLRDA